MDFKQILQQYWGYPDFRGIQLDIIQSIASGRDTLGLMPTGGGKSITFQVPALAQEGMCLVVTPLVALMKDQVENLKQRGIRAAAVYSGMSQKEIQICLDNAALGGYKFLYVSPERLATPLFMQKVRRMDVTLITVDEAHCISQWGYDFRPSYLRIAEVRTLLPNVPVLALTATATRQVVEDIQLRLGFPEPNVFRMSFERKNLRYVVRRTDVKEEELMHILRSVPGAAIVYTRSRRATVEIAEMLNAKGIRALHYHAGLPSVDKDVRQQAWIEDEVRVMVATNAFGMGIDKPDVRLVVHMDIPDSIEAYFQEAGRGGRDGHIAYAVLLYDRYDAMKLRARVVQSFPDREYIRKVYSDLSSFFQIAEGEAEGCTYDFAFEKFCRVFRHHPVMLASALQLLSRAGYIHFSIDDEHTSRVVFLMRRDELYNIDYLDASENMLLNALMRLNAGLFADYVTISETSLAEACDLTPDEVYHKLLHLTRLRILHYVPHKQVPQITYITRRIDSEYVQLKRDVYEDRKKECEQRTEAMIHYFTDDTQCRSRMLLQYFGDDAADCGHCDVCIARKQTQVETSNSTEVEKLCAYLLETMVDGQQYLPEEVLPVNIEPQVARAAFEWLMREGKIRVHDARIMLS